MDAAFKDPEPPSYTEAQSYPSVQPIIELKPESEWTSPPLITATAPPMPTTLPMPTTPSMPTIPPVAPVPPMAPGQIPIDLNMLVTPQQMDILLHVARQQMSTLQSQLQQQQEEEEAMGTICHLIIVIVITVNCALFNITSLIPFGIPAILCSLMAYRNKKKEKYATAKKLGYIAYFLSLFNIIFSALFTIFAIIAISFQFFS